MNAGHEAVNAGSSPGGAGSEPVGAGPGTDAVMLNVAATRVGTEALGPGLRSVVWVQECPFNCRGCMAPDWIPARQARAVTPAELVAELLADPGVEGLTFSGGEPMLQAAGLAETVRLARAVRDVSVICFTGYRLENLEAGRTPTPGAPDLLAVVDVLIDGTYVAALDDGRGLRGSANQRVHHLTPRLSDGGFDFTGRSRGAEIAVSGNEALLIGVPPAGLLPAFDIAVDSLRTHTPPRPRTRPTPAPHTEGS